MQVLQLGITDYSDAHVAAVAVMQPSALEH